MSIISDRDPRMTSLFWKRLFENLGTRFNFSLAYHPQTDDQSEMVNSTVLDLIKSYVEEVAHKNQWEMYLPLVEYAYNNTMHTSNNKSSFEIIEVWGLGEHKHKEEGRYKEMQFLVGRIKLSMRASPYSL